MKIKTVRLMFLGVCILLGILLLTRVLNIVVSSAIFAIALVVFGLLSRSAKE